MSRKLWMAVAGVALAGVVVVLAARGDSSESSSASTAAEQAPVDLNAARRSGSLRPVWERKTAAEAAAGQQATSPAPTKTSEPTTITDSSGTTIAAAPPSIKGGDTAMQKIRSRGGHHEPTEPEMEKLIEKYESMNGPMSEADKERFGKTIARIRRPTGGAPAIERVPGQRKLQAANDCTGPQAQERYKAMTVIDQQKMRERCQAHGFVPPQ